MQRMPRISKLKYADLQDCKGVLMAFGIKISKADKLFSLYIRDRANWRCERCHAQYQYPTASLHCSHFWSRRCKSVRFDEDNAAALCFGCHNYFSSMPQEHRDFFMKRLGTRNFNLLTMRRNNLQRIDESLIVLGLKPLLKAKGYRV